MTPDARELIEYIVGLPLAALFAKTHRVNSCVYLNDCKTPAITGENGLTMAGCVCPDPKG